MRPILFTLLTGALLTGSVTGSQAQIKVNLWLTDPDKSVYFKEQANGPVLRRSPATAGDGAVITVDPGKTFQSIDGYGWALTGGSAQHILRMSPAARAALLKDLISPTADHIGGSYLRVSIGASDLNDHVFSYDDMPDGK